MEKISNAFTTIEDAVHNIIDTIRDRIDTFKMENPRKYKRIKKTMSKALRYALAFMCGFLLALIVLRSGQNKQIAAMEQRLIEAQQTVESEKEPTPGQLWSQQNQLAENLARVLQGVDRYDLSKAQKLAYLQVLNNRANPNIQYDIMKGTDDLDSVLQVPQQFEGFVYGEGYYTKTNFEIAQEFLNGEQNYLNSDRYFWARISTGSFVAMDSFDGSGSNQKVN